MTPRDISGTDLRVSPLCLGTALFGATIDTPTAYALLDAFFARGGNFIDTARSYSDWIPGERGRSEGLIGRWFADRRNRERAIVATKGGDAADDGAPRLAARDLASDLDASLTRLHVDVIDLYYLHRDAPSTTGSTCTCAPGRSATWAARTGRLPAFARPTLTPLVQARRGLSPINRCGTPP